MLVKAYFDESHQHAEAMPASAVSAVAATGLEWERFTREWLKLLGHRDYNVVDKKGRRVFHTAEFESPEGRKGTVYESSSQQKRNDFHNALLDIIATSRIRCFAASVIATEYDDVAKTQAQVNLGTGMFERERSKLFGNKYFFCAYQAMNMAAYEARRYYPPHVQVSYYFESGGDNYRQPINLLYNIAMADSKSDEQNYFKFFIAPHFGPKDSAVPLQAADKIAYECAKETSHICDLNPPAKHSEVRDGRTQWRQRYAPLYLFSRGTDIELRYWRREHLEGFFQAGEKGAALPEDETD